MSVQHVRRAGIALAPQRSLAVRIERFGGPEVMQLTRVPVDEPGSGELLVRVHAAGVNPVDVKIRQGKRHSEALRAPLGLGVDAAGVVRAVGANVTAFHVGDRVFGSGLTSAYAEYLTGPAESFAALPNAVPFLEGAALGLPVGTAHQALISLGVSPGQTLLVHGGAGGVGQAAIQLARLIGANVIATARATNHARMRELGAQPVEYGDGLLDAVRRLAPGGIDRVLDAAGTREALTTSLAVVAAPRHIGELVNVEWSREFGVSAYSASRPGYVDAEQQALRSAALPYVAQLRARGKFHAEIARVLPLGEVRAAHRLMEHGHLRGRIVLSVVDA